MNPMPAQPPAQGEAQVPTMRASNHLPLGHSFFTDNKHPVCAGTVLTSCTGLRISSFDALGLSTSTEKELVREMTELHAFIRTACNSHVSLTAEVARLRGALRKLNAAVDDAGKEGTAGNLAAAQKEAAALAPAVPGGAIP